MEVKDHVQQKAIQQWTLKKCWGLIDMATGTGKSKVAVDIAKRLVELDPDAVIFLAVPTKKLRDNNWKDEFYKWDAGNVWENNLTRVCYASLSKVKTERISLLILDEGHNLTKRSAKIFTTSKIEKLLVLTASAPEMDGPPDERAKVKLLESLRIYTVFRVTFEEALDLGLISPVNIKVIHCFLDGIQNYVPWTTKKGTKYLTEQKVYDRLEWMLKVTIERGGDPTFTFNRRAKYIRSIFVNKREIAKYLFHKLIPESKRYLLFCSDIDQAENVLPGRTFHSKSGPEAFDAFLNKEINQLGVVKAINEGHNIPELDGAFIIQIDSVRRAFIQRIGRTARFRKDHESDVYVFIYQNTVDQQWFDMATSKFPKRFITHYFWKDLLKDNLAVV